MVRIQPHSCSILVVDDSATVAELVADVLRDELHYHPVAVTHPKAAIARLPELQPDLFIFDVGLPGIDGLELYRRVQALPEGRGVPVLFITANTVAIRRVRAQGFRVLAKPLDLGELTREVETLLHAAA